jgi:hypothetical protein
VQVFPDLARGQEEGQLQLWLDLLSEPNGDKMDRSTGMVLLAADVQRCARRPCNSVLRLSPHYTINEAVSSLKVYVFAYTPP